AAIQYQVRVLEMDGLGWRESLYSRLRPVAHQGSTTVWTAGRDLTRALADRAVRVVTGPRVVAPSEVTAQVAQSSIRKVASRWTRHADGPIDRAITVAYTPDLEELRDGYQLTVSGRKIDQGILARMVVDETRV